jgi:hypothetical protein
MSLHVQNRHQNILKALSLFLIYIQKIKIIYKTNFNHFTFRSKEMQFTLFCVNKQLKTSLLLKLQI